MSRALAQLDRVDASAIEAVIAAGDLKDLTSAERVAYYNNTCWSLGLNPFTKPFEFISLGNNLTMYATRGATDQLRDVHGVRIVEIERERTDEMMTVTATAEMPDGRRDTSTGIVWIKGLQGENLANAIMKAETKAKRRVTLSICGLGWMDETEVETVRDARRVTVTEDGEIIDAPAPSSPKDASGRQLRYMWAVARERGWHDEDIHSAIHDWFGCESIGEMTRRNMSELIERIASGERWVDPRQQRIELPTNLAADGEALDEIEAGFRELGEAEAPATTTATSIPQAVNNATWWWYPDGKLKRWNAGGDPAQDIDGITQAAHFATTPEQIRELREFVKALGLGSDDELKAMLTARYRDLGGNGQNDTK